MIKKICRVMQSWCKRREARRYLTRLLAMGAPPREFDGSRETWETSIESPTEFYLATVRYFHFELAKSLREHRAYFVTNGRGFGEDAFHVQWAFLVKALRPRLFLEIGVYRGQVLSLVALLQREFGIDGKVVGISPFQPVGDSVSTYLQSIDYQADTLENFKKFGLSEPELVTAYSTDSLARERVLTHEWDAIYIDGNHDYAVAKADWELCASALRPGGVIILDDAGLDTAFRPPPFSTAGHPGPSRVATEVDRTLFDEILQVGHNRVFQKREPDQLR